ncbi:Hint domain-containing protein [Paracoccus sp. (in: a-proteobacteria)]|uniref:Hint domain-containing protein n=1 Tax=Paracoccus sp. TaxID=267 RepID=UPI0028AA0ECA|nr:Hint domain-containing protein [Paracoccus sp. (in: a-proteobacteria)]
MATLTFDTGAIATGNNVGGGLEVSSLPIDTFLTSQGITDTSNAVFIIEFQDGDLEYSDVTGDGQPEFWVPSGTQPTAMYIDVNNDGTPEYVVRDQNNNSPMTRDNQSGAHMAKINQSLNVYAYPDEPGDPSLETTGGNLYFATDGEPFTVGDIRAPIDDTTGADNQLIMDDAIVCFTRGTLISTPKGLRKIEDLRLGDLAETLDHGPQPIRWIGSRKINGISLTSRSELRPIRIPAGALGRGYPEQDLLVSPQHRIALSSPITRRMFGHEEVLVPAKHLIGYAGIEVETATEVEYFHFILDRHELVWANGALTETMLAGPMALKALGPDQCRELALIFPEIEMPGFMPSPARRILKRHENKQTLRRHEKNGKSLYDKVVMR